MSARGGRLAAGGPSRPPASRALRLIVPEVTGKERLEAAVTLADRACGPADLRELLDAAGLDLGDLKALRGAGL